MNNLSTTVASSTTGRAAVPLWAWAIVAIALFSVYFVLQENGGILSASAAQFLHEVTHDGRHSLGVPCH